MAGWRMHLFDVQELSAHLTRLPETIILRICVSAEPVILRYLSQIISEVFFSWDIFYWLFS